MDLANPASMLLSSSTTAVLRVLVGAETAFTMREVARLAQVSPPVARDIIRRLAEHGLVLTSPAGSATLCRFNKEHLAAEPIRALVTLRTAMVKLLRDTLRTWPVPPVHASLFGSAARGDGGTGSDLDILLVRPDLNEERNALWQEQLYAFSERLILATGNAPSWFDVTSAELASTVEAGEPIVDSWRRDSITLAGPDLATMLRSPV